MKQVKPIHCHRRVSRVSCPNGTLAVFHRMTAISQPMGQLASFRKTIKFDSFGKVTPIGALSRFWGLGFKNKRCHEVTPTSFWFVKFSAKI